MIKDNILICFWFLPLGCESSYNSNVNPLSDIGLKLFSPVVYVAFKIFPQCPLLCQSFSV